MPSRILHITREGWPWLLFLALLGIVVFQKVSPTASLPLGLATLFAAAFFWDSRREIPPKPMGVVAPVDGRVMAIIDEHDVLLDRPARRISIRVSLFASYMLRAATEGQITELCADARALLQGRSASWLHTDEGHDVLMVVESGSLLGARPCRARYGERVGQGRRCGVRRLARQIDVLVPANSRVDVALGDYVKGGETVVATLAREATSGQDSDDSTDQAHD